MCANWVKISFKHFRDNIEILKPTVYVNKANTVKENASYKNLNPLTVIIFNGQLSDPIFVSLMYFAPELFFADTSTLSCFHRIEIENNSILAELSPLGAFFPDLIFIGF